MTETESSTTILRRMLDERGVEWRESVNVVNCVFTIYESPIFGEVAAMDNDGTLYFHELNGIDVTPEQAITATLGDERLAFLEEKTKLQGDYIYKLLKEKDELQKALNNAAGNWARADAELHRILDGFEHECYMLRVEASETRAKDEAVRDAYERIREESARAIAATLGAEECEDEGGIGANGEQVFSCSECGCVLSLYDSDGMNTLCTGFVHDYPRFCPSCGKAVKR